MAISNQNGAPNLEAEASPTMRSSTPLKDAYVAHVAHLKQTLPHNEAMELAIGGGFEIIGPIEAAILRHYGLPATGHIIDVGCGSGRLAKPLSSDWRGTYLGIDLVPDLVEHARTLSQRPDWRFEVVDNIEIPEADGRADLVCFFSVMTHLTQEQSYWYIEEARRVLKPGGVIVFSFLEFHNPTHWSIFESSVETTKADSRNPMNVFMARDSLEIWASHLGLELVDIRGGSDVIVPEGPLGQSVCVMRKPFGG